MVSSARKTKRKKASSQTQILEPKRKRGRPRKVEVEVVEVVEVPKRKRGRPPKVKVVEKAVEAPKRKRGRPRKVEVVEAPKRKRGRPRKVEVVEAPKRKRGRPPKVKVVVEVETPKRKRGRPRKTAVVAEAEVVEEVVETPKRKRGRPRKTDAEKALKLPALESTAKRSEEAKITRNALEQIMFKLPSVKEPLIGTPKEVQRELDTMAKRMQNYPDEQEIFDKIHLYMHGYLVNVVLKKFPFIRGFQTVDIYQETLIALRFKAIPGFKKNKGMSFLNFSKLCIRRHLITLLNASKVTQKHQCINQAISLDSSPLKDDDDDRNTFANIIKDNKDSADEKYEKSEAIELTKNSLMECLSEFEQVVLSEYLSSSSYREISSNVSKRTKKRCDTKSIDNALLRIRKKAMSLRRRRHEELPIFMKK